MPLLRRQQFIREKPPPDLKPDEEVFYCKLTGEVFRDYDHFFERIILCNSLVWSCSITGKAGLTYPEAQEQEDRARKQLASFPDILQKPILYLVALTHRTRLNALIDDVFAFCKDRYFLGESLNVTVRDERRPGKLVKVNAPAGSGTKTIPKIVLNGGSPDKPLTIDDSDDEVICLGTEQVVQTNTKMADPSKYTYTIQEKGKLNTHTVGPSLIHRKKGLFNRDKLKLYLKLHCETTQEGIWTVKQRFINKFSLNALAFSTIYSGPLPNFTKTDVSKKVLKPKPNSVQKVQKKPLKKQVEKAKTIAAVEALKNPKLTLEERTALKQKLKEAERVQKEAHKEELRERLLEEKARMKEQRTKEREKHKVEKQQRDDEMKEWSRPREDLECEDLKPLPVPTAVQMTVPIELFGDIVMVLEYLKCFSGIFNMQEEFPDGLTVVSLSRILAETEVNGGLFDLLKFLLTAVFNLQAEEMDEEEVDEEGQAAATIDVLNNEAGTFSSEALIRSATIASQWPQLNYGSPLNKLQLDPFTLTEVLRLHFLSSGAKSSNRNAKFQNQQRGGYTSMDDAGLELRSSEPAIMKALTNHNLFDMQPADKLRLLVALVNQLLTYVVARDLLDDNYENMRQLKNELRLLQAAEIRREKDQTQYWHKKRVEEKTKEREDKKKQREDKLKLDELSVQAKAKGLELRELAKAENLEYLLDDKKALDKTEPKDEQKSDKPTEEKPERTSTRQKVAKQKVDIEKEIPTENIEWDKVTAEEQEEWKQIYSAKKIDLLERIHKLQHGYAIYPVGRDRTFRRYWIFRSLPGLFIEDNEKRVSSDFFTPVEQTGSHVVFDSKSLPLSDSTKQNDVSEEKSTGSDKENDHKLGNGTGIITGEKAHGDIVKSVDANDVDTKKSLLTETVFDQIARRNSVHWSYIDNSDQFSQLIESLNARGYREGVLKTALIEVKDTVSSSIENCPKSELQLPDTSIGVVAPGKSSKSRNRVTNNTVNKTSAKEFLEINLRDIMLDLEERIYGGALGVIKVCDRNKWVKALEEGYYQKKSSQMHIQTSPSQVTNRTEWRGELEKSGYKVQNNELTWSGKKEEHIKTEMEKLEEDSDSGSDKTEKDIDPAVRDLRMALLQIEQGVDKKYLNPPLGEDENTKRARQKAALEAAFKGLQNGGKDKKSKDAKDKNKDSDSSSESDSEEENEAMKKTPLERWEESLMSSTSLPQVFLHISVLERSIVWSKSALHARCRVCRRKGDAEHMLLCDGCDRGHHMYCLKPVVKSVPKGDWYCVVCRPKVIVQTPRKARRSISTRTEESEPEEEEEEEESDDGAEDESEEEAEDSDDAQELEDSDEEAVDSDAEEADSNDEDGDDDDDDDDDDDGEGDDDSESEESDSDEEEVKPAAVKLIKTHGRTRAGSAPSSGRSTPIIATGKRCKTPTLAPTSRGRVSLESSGPSAKRSRGADVAAKGSAKGASKSTGKKTASEPQKTAAHKREEKAKHSRSNSARALVSHATVKATKRKLDMEDTKEPPTKIMASKSRGGDVSKLKQCEDLVHELAENTDSWPFIRPVTKRDAPDYHVIIKTPMNFQTMKAKMNNFVYLEPAAILEDLRLIFENCERYNQTNTDEYLAGQRLCRHFVRRVKELQLNTVLTGDHTNTDKQSNIKRGKAATKGSPKLNGGTKTNSKVKAAAKESPKTNTAAKNSPKSGGRRRSGRNT